MKNEKSQSEGYPLTFPEVQVLWEKRMITAKGYLHLALLCTDGHCIKARTLVDFCEEMGLKKRTFHDAKNQLIKEGLLAVIEPKAKNRLITIKLTD